MGGTSSYGRLKELFDDKADFLDVKLPSAIYFKNTKHMVTRMMEATDARDLSIIVECILIAAESSTPFVDQDEFLFWKEQHDFIALCVAPMNGSVLAKKAKLVKAKG